MCWSSYSSDLFYMGTTMTTCPICNKSHDKASRELDACVAKAMGWTDIKPLGTKPLGYKGQIWVGIDPQRKDTHPVPMPHYSTDIRDAMELWKDGWHLTQRGSNHIGGMDGYWVIKTISPMATHEISIAETPALAICHAFLMKEG